MTESKFQASLIKRFEEKGWYVIKLMTTNKNGVPDLILLKPNKFLFVEVKNKDGIISKLQEYRHKELKSRGFLVATLFANDVFEDFNNLIKVIE